VGPLEENVSFMASISVLIKLTPLGIEKIDQVLNIVHNFIEKLREMEDFSPFY